MGIFDLITGKQKLIDEIKDKELVVRDLERQIRMLHNKNEDKNNEIDKLQNFLVENDIAIKGIEERLYEKDTKLNDILLKIKLKEDEERREEEEKIKEIEEKSNKFILPSDYDREEYDENDKYEDIVIKRLERKKGNPFNDEQRFAIKHKDNHLRIIAGAGSGKTETICSKAVYLTKVEKVSPERICMITFTKKAAKEMRDRIDDISDRSCNKMVIGTFNSIFQATTNEILKLEQFDFLKPYLVLGKHDSKDGEENSNYRYNTCLKKLMKKYTLYSFQILEGSIKSKLEYWSSMGYSNEKIREIIKNHYETDKDKKYNKETEVSLSERFYEMLCEFDENRRSGKIYLLTDQILNMYKITTYAGEKEDLISNYLENKFDYIFVDEFQDTNGMQIDIIKRFIPTYRDSNAKLVIVGDANQAIYMFRGSDSSYIQNFDSIYEGKLDTINLLKNYRSVQDIVVKANNLITHNYRNNKPTYSFEMDSFNESSDVSVAVNLVGSKQDEVKATISRIVDDLGKNKPFKLKGLSDEEKELIEDNANLKSLDDYPNFTQSVILFRSTHQVIDLVKEFEARKIPYIIEKEVDTSLANTYPFKTYFIDMYELIKSKQSKEDWDKFMFSVAEKTFIKTGALENEYIKSQYSKSIKDKLYDVDELITFINSNKLKYELQVKEKQCIKSYIEIVREICEGKLVKPIELISILMKFSKEKSDVEKWKGIEADSLAYFSFGEIVNEYEEINKDNSKKKENENKKKLYDNGNFNGVYFLTIHKSKGLAFENVFIVGCSENSFPSKRAVAEDSINMTICQEKAEPPTTIEEERRLMYVALTRAKKKAFITCPLDNGNMPSIFIEEIKKRLV